MPLLLAFGGICDSRTGRVQYYYPRGAVRDCPRQTDPLPPGVYPTALMSLSKDELFSDSNSLWPACAAALVAGLTLFQVRVPLVRYNPIVSSVARLGREHTRRSSMHDDFSDDDGDFTPANSQPMPTA
ncbi:hypothetical protein BC827DRAFT_1158255 [Russula dissimulans]|nr:hypothetical protein BC827DRAFT_1158255 [Russula dissimulans]